MMIAKRFRVQSTSGHYPHFQDNIFIPVPTHHPHGQPFHLHRSREISFAPSPKKIHPSYDLKEKTNEGYSLRPIWSHIKIYTETHTHYTYEYNQKSSLKYMLRFNVLNILIIN